MTPGKLIKRLRGEMTQEELIGRVNQLAGEDGLAPITQQFLSKIESKDGNRVKSSPYFPYFAKALNITVKELLSGRAPKDQPKQYGYEKDEKLVDAIIDQLKSEGPGGELSRKLQRMLKRKTG